MKSSMRLLAAASLAVLLALPSGCDKSDPTAPDSSTLAVDANPTNLVLDKGQAGHSTIIATLLDSEGGPISGLVVHFSTNSGSLRSSGDGVKTNSDGEARDVLTLHAEDLDATVTARARGAGNDTVSVTVTGPGENIAPNGTIDQPSSNTTVAPGAHVTFAGTGTDSDNNTPLTFAWSFPGGNPATSNVEDPPAPGVLYSTAGTYTVIFTVTDSRGLADATPATRVITVNTAPTASITTPAGPTTINATQSVNFTGTASDADAGDTLTFLWTFGTNGPANSNVEDPGNVTFPTAGTFTVNFTATDNHGSASTPATVVVTVNP